MATTTSKLHRFRTEDAALVPPDCTDGPAAHRLPIGDALYCAWILGNMRLMGCRCYGVSQVMDALGGDEEMTALGALGFVERWKVNQVTLYYWGPLLDLMLECNPGMPEADVAPARAWATVRRSGFYYYLGAAGDGALLYDAFEDLLFAAKGLMSAIPFLLEQQMGLGGAGAPPLLRRRVQIGGLGARPELNGELALAMAFDASAGRYTVILEQTGECVRVRPANLTRTAEDGYAASLLYLTLLPFEGAIVYDGVIAAPDGGGANRQWNASFTRAWTEGPGKSWAAKVNDAAAELRRRDPIRALLPEHAQLICSRWRGGLATHMGANMPSAIRGQTLFLPGELEFVPPEEVGPVTSTPEAANHREWWSAE